MDTSLIINTSMLSCASNVIPHCWQLFFENPNFVASSSPPRSLPIYAETMTSTFAAQFSPSSIHSKSKRCDHRVLGFIDLEAES
jgi:hypothetical protein